MLRVLFFIFWFFIAENVSGQVKLGATIYELKQAFPDYEYEFKNATGAFLGDKWLIAEDDYSIVMHLISSDDNKSYFATIYPKTMNYLQLMVDVYNKDCVIISNRVWKRYANGGAVIKIELKYAEKIGWSFDYTGE